MSILAAQEFRQHVNRMSTLQAEVVALVNGGVIDYAALALLGSRSGFDFTAEEARKVLSETVELSDFEREIVARAAIVCPVQAREQNTTHG